MSRSIEGWRSLVDGSVGGTPEFRERVAQRCLAAEQEIEVLWAEITLARNARAAVDPAKGGAS